MPALLCIPQCKMVLHGVSLESEQKSFIRPHRRKLSSIKGPTKTLVKTSRIEVEYFFQTETESTIQLHGSTLISFISLCE